MANKKADTSTQQPSLFGDAPTAVTLTQFNLRVKSVLAHDVTLQNQWVQAETSDVQVRRGHCYLELIEKNPDTGATMARLGAVIWAGEFAKLNAKFTAITGSTFATDMKVMVCLSANFHEQYGLKAVITDINPEFTLGDMARQRKEIVDRLTREGVIDMNKELPWPLVPQRVAVISAAGAAGYGDFMNQLDGNQYGLKFYTHLFTALMQGTNTVSSVLAALDRINRHVDLFDCVVIIRGGGSTSDLNSFDNYDLAAAIAQFPIPVITGIGHERDVTVLDYVAALRVKTPTAAAEFLIGRGADALAHVNELRTAVVTAARDITGHAREQLAYFTSLLPGTARRIVETSALHLKHLGETIPQLCKSRLATERQRMDHDSQLIKSAALQRLETAKLQFAALSDKAQLLSPRNTLNRGYALVMRGGAFVTESTTLAAGDVMTVHLKHGSVRAEVREVRQPK